MIPVSQFVDIDNPDIPIYRVFSNRRLFETFKNRELSLVAPRLWQDPFENFLANSHVILPRAGGVYASLGGVFKNFFGQCWTYHPESEAMWRIYSHDNKGAKVRTTPRKLLTAIYDPKNPFHQMSYFIAHIQYSKESEIRKAFEDPSFAQGIILDSSGRNQIVPLQIKRKEFEYEAEIRLIFKYNKEGDNRELTQDAWSFPTDPFSLFDEVVFDPRMSGDDFAKYSDELKRLGFNKAIEKSQLYQAPNLTITLDV